MNNKKITKKINFLLKEEVLPGWTDPSIPQIGSPDGPVAPLPKDRTWNPNWWTDGDLIDGVRGVHPWWDIPEFLPLIPYLDPFLSPFGDHNPSNNDTPRDDSDGDDAVQEDDNGFEITPGFSQPARIPAHLIPNIPKSPNIGWENYFEEPAGSGQWWYCPYGSPNNPNRLPSGIKPTRHATPGLWGTWGINR
jgi:hypothetical protein